jgi:hypothetical protein
MAHGHSAYTTPQRILSARFNLKFELRVDKSRIRAAKTYDSDGILEPCYFGTLTVYFDALVVESSSKSVMFLGICNGSVLQCRPVRGKNESH